MRLSSAVAGACCPALAVAPNGDILVAEMFGDDISTISPGRTRARTLFEAASAAGVELGRGTVYATTDVSGEGGAPGDGAVVSYQYRSGRWAPRVADAETPAPPDGGTGVSAARALSAQMS